MSDHVDRAEYTRLQRLLANLGEAAGVDLVDTTPDELTERMAGIRRAAAYLDAREHEARHHGEDTPVYDRPLLPWDACTVQVHALVWAMFEQGAASHDWAALYHLLTAGASPFLSLNGTVYAYSAKSHRYSPVDEWKPRDQKDLVKCVLFTWWDRNKTAILASLPLPQDPDRHRPAIAKNTASHSRMRTGLGKWQQDLWDAILTTVPGHVGEAADRVLAESKAFTGLADGNVVNLRTATVEPWRQGLFITDVVPYTAEEFLEANEEFAMTFLSRNFADVADDRSDSRVRTICRMLGYFATGEIRAQLVFLFIGLPKSGKSTLLDKVLPAIVGKSSVGQNLKAAHVVGADEVTVGGHDDALVRATYGKRVTYTVDLAPKGKTMTLNSAFLKNITSDTLTGSCKHQDGFTWTNSTKLVLQSNLMPQTSTHDEGTYRRLAFVHCPYTVDTSKPDHREPLPNFEQEIELKRSQISFFKLAVRWAAEYYADPEGFTKESMHQPDQDLFNRFITARSDVIAKFLSFYEPVPIKSPAEEMTLAFDIRRDYQLYCRATNAEIKKQWAAELKESLASFTKVEDSVQRTASSASSDAQSNGQRPPRPRYWPVRLREETREEYEGLMEAGQDEGKAALERGAARRVACEQAADQLRASTTTSVIPDLLKSAI